MQQTKTEVLAVLMEAEAAVAAQRPAQLEALALLAQSVSYGVSLVCAAHRLSLRQT